VKAVTGRSSPSISTPLIIWSKESKKTRSRTMGERFSKALCSRSAAAASAEFEFPLPAPPPKSAESFT
jgi:hypothetical protein